MESTPIEIVGNQKMAEKRTKPFECLNLRKVRKFREEKGLGIHQLAGALGVTDTQCGKKLNGQNAFTDAEQLALGALLVQGGASPLEPQGWIKDSEKGSVRKMKAAAAKLLGTN